MKTAILILGMIAIGCSKPIAPPASLSAPAAESDPADKRREALVETLVEKAKARRVRAQLRYP
jgi:hypothetical protein